MKKSEIVKNVAEITRKNYDGKVTHDMVEAVIDAYVETIVNAFAADKDERIIMKGLGTFASKHVAERRGVDRLHKTGEWVSPAHDELVFKVSKEVKKLN